MCHTLLSKLYLSGCVLTFHVNVMHWITLVSEAGFQILVSLFTLSESRPPLTSWEWRLTSGNVTRSCSDDVWRRRPWKREWGSIQSLYITSPPSNHEPWMRIFILFKSQFQFIFLGWGLGLSVLKAILMHRVVKVVKRKNQKSPSSNETWLWGVSYPDSETPKVQEKNEQKHQWG